MEKRAFWSNIQREILMKSSRGLWLCVALFSVSAYAQLGEAPLPQPAAAKKAGTSLEETQRWIIDKLREIGLHANPDPHSPDRPDYKTRYRYEAFFDGCKFSIVSANTNIIDYDAVHFMVLDGSLADLSDDRSKNYIKTIAGAEKISAAGKRSFDAIQGPAVLKVMSGDRATIAELLPEQRRIAKVYSSVLQFKTLDEVMQSRLASAFIHAASLCREQEAARRQTDLSRSAKRQDEPF